MSYTGKEFCKSILSCTFKENSSLSSDNGGKKENSHCEQTQTSSAQNFHGVLFFLPTSYTSYEEIKFRPFLVLHPHTSLLCVQKSIRHCRQFLFKMQVKNQRCVEVCTTSNKAQRVDLLLWVYVCMYLPTELLNKHPSAEVPSSFTCKM